MTRYDKKLNIKRKINTTGELDLRGERKTMKKEIVRDIQNKSYAHLYMISLSGRIIAKKNGYVRVAKGSPYNFTYVHLCKNGKRELFKTFDLWKDAFGHDYDESNYKGLK